MKLEYSNLIGLALLKKQTAQAPDYFYLKSNSSTPHISLIQASKNKRIAHSLTQFIPSNIHTKLKT